MSFKNIKFSEPVESLSGKKNKGDKLCFFQGRAWRTNKQRAWGTGERNMITHPETDNERQQKQKFTTVAKTVAEKKQTTSPTYAQDIAAYASLSAAEKAKYPTFRSFLWHREWNK